MHTLCAPLRFVACFVLVACATPAPPAPTHPTPATATTVSRSLPASSNQPGVAVGAHAAVASAETHASQVGLNVLKSGGNAVDAAVAVAFALAVTHPSAGNLGGGGFMIVHRASGEAIALDYREVAPLKATRGMYVDAAGKLTQASVVGPLAAGVPGTVAGMELAHRRFGTKPWAELLAPAIALARGGHVLDASHADDMREAAAKMKEAGFEASARIYLGPDQQPLAAGSTWKQPELAATLQIIATEGARAFYTGALAKTLAARMQEIGGIWSEADLAEYAAAVREPIRFTYLGHELITMPPPSAGGIVLRQLLFASELLDLKKHPPRSPDAFHLYVEASRRAYADRNQWVADPDFVKVPIAGLLDAGYIQSRMTTIDPAHATPSSSIQAGAPREESKETTHFSVVDAQGNAVSNTYTLNTGFGAKVVLPGTGILLNNEMDDFAAQPGTPNVYGLVQGEQNAIAPRKRMLSSMTPTIVLKNGQLRAVLGTPGGPTITTTVAQLVRALVDYGLPLDEAIRAGRVHHQWLPDAVFVEANVEPAIVEGLKARGHKVDVRPDSIGHADCIEVDPKTQGFRAVADVTRGGGSAMAY